MRYARADRLIQLALEMQAARGGLTLSDIEARFEVSRRTAIRMREAVLRVFPQADEVPSNDRSKRWRLSTPATRPLLAISADDLATIEHAAAQMAADNLGEAADELRGVAAKIRASIAAELLRRIEPDLGALAEAEGIALRPGPRPAIAPALFATLRGAIKACRKVSFTYAGRASGAKAVRVVRPLGFLYGHRHYLVAINDADPDETVRFYSLPQISRLRLTGESFVRDPGFDLRAFVAPSFGVFEEAAVDIVWRFSAAAAPIAQQFQFHPSQTSAIDDDGRLVVRFHAGGLLEMAWHLMSWGRAVEVIEPAALRDLLPAEMPVWPALP